MVIISIMQTCSATPLHYRHMFTSATLWWNDSLRRFIGSQMTLHLSQASRVAGIQISDRLVTANREEHDAKSNKTLVIIGSDGIASVSYFGLAYIRDDTADNFMAKSLIGEPPLFSGRIPAFGPTLNGGHRSIDEMINKIKDDLEWWFDHCLNDKWHHSFGLSICGWRNKGAMPEPILFSMLKKEKSAKFAYIDNPGRHWWLKKDSCTNDLPKGYLNDADYDLIRRLPNVTADTNLIEFVRTRKDCFLDIIRRASASTGLVGLDAMVVVLPRPDAKRVYVDLESIYRWDVRDDLLGVIPATFTPWIIGNSRYIAPSVRTGGVHPEPVDDYIVEINVPANNSGVFQVSSIARPHKPS